MSIQGKVAAILNEREFIINKGEEAGVKPDMRFKVLEPERDLIDPDTGEPLGTFSREKIRVKIAEVELKYSVGRTYETYVINVGGDARPQPLNEILRYFGRSVPGQQVTRVRTLRGDSTTRLEPMDEASSFVKIGDLVVQINDDSEA